jgi:hypothetical protein
MHESPLELGASENVGCSAPSSAWLWQNEARSPLKAGLLCAEHAADSRVFQSGAQCAPRQALQRAEARLSQWPGFFSDKESITFGHCGGVGVRRAAR